VNKFVQISFMTHLALATNIVLANNTCKWQTF